MNAAGDRTLDAGHAARRRLRGAGWLRLAFLVLFAAAIPLLACRIGAVRGPFYFEYNTDPAYAYLLNSLLVAEGRTPHHIDHPGTPVQMIGAGVIRAAHLFSGQGAFRDDVLTRPERSLRAVQFTIVGLVTALSLWGGMMALRATGSVLHAALVQLTPLLSMGVCTQIDRVKPEPLLVGLGIALSGLVLLVVHRRGDDAPAADPGRADRGAAVVMGILVGIGVASKILFAPVALVALAALPGWRHRALFAGAAAGALLVSVLPIVSRAGRVMRWIGGLATRTGRYGRGEPGFVDPSVYPSQLAGLISHESLIAALAGAGALVCVASMLWLARSGMRRAERGSSPRSGERLLPTLAATAAVQAGLILVVAKQPSGHYLATAASLGGLSLSLMVSVVAGRGRARGATVLAAAAAALVVTLGVRRVQNINEWLESVRAVVAMERAGDEYLRGPEGAGVVHGFRISSVPSGLQFGNAFAGWRYTEDLARLHPGIVTWGASGIGHFKGPTRAQGLPLRPGMELRVMASSWFDTAASPRPPGFVLKTLRLFGREQLIRAVYIGDADPAPFEGFEHAEGLAPPESPPPGFDLRAPGRWGLMPGTRTVFDSRGGRMLLAIEARRNGRGKQVMTIVHNGREVKQHRFARPPQIERLLVELEAAPGRNEVEIRYSEAQTVGGREVGVMFRRLQLTPDRAHADESEQ